MLIVPEILNLLGWQNFDPKDTVLITKLGISSFVRFLKNFLFLKVSTSEICLDCVDV